MIRIFLHEGGVTRSVDRLDPAWLQPTSGVSVWVDLIAHTPDEARILEVFKFHELAIDARTGTIDLVSPGLKVRHTPQK